MKHLLTGQVLTRRDIAALFGGNARAFLPRISGGHIVAGCFDPAMNPRLPFEVLVHDSINAQLAARSLVEQCRTVSRVTAANGSSESVTVLTGSIPIFIKLQPNVWQFSGMYRADRYATDPDEVAMRVYEINPRIYQKYVRSYGEMRGILFLEDI